MGPAAACTAVVTHRAKNLRHRKITLLLHPMPTTTPFPVTDWRENGGLPSPKPSV
jgi:hypothetical protein